MIQIIETLTPDRRNIRFLASDYLNKQYRARCFLEANWHFRHHHQKNHSNITRRLHSICFSNTINQSWNFLFVSKAISTKWEISKFELCLSISLAVLNFLGRRIPDIFRFCSPWNISHFYFCRRTLSLKDSFDTWWSGKTSLWQRLYSNSIVILTSGKRLLLGKVVQKTVWV